MLEKASCKSALSALLCTKIPLSDPVSRHSLNPVVSFKIWNQFRRAFSLTDLSMQAPIMRNHMFPPSITDAAFNCWVEKGLVTLKDLYSDFSFMSFYQMRAKYNIPQTHFFRYLQIRSFMISNTLDFSALPTESLLDTILKISPLSKNNIGLIYSLISSQNVTSLTKSKQQWESELDLLFSEETWQDIINKIHSTSICLRHTIIQFKVVHRLHWTKQKLAKFSPNINSLCDRCRVEIANHTQMFWSCSKLVHFWQLIFNFLSEVLNFSIDPSPILAIFGLTTELCLDNNTKNMISFSTLIAYIA